jgi:group I intron endonuclease
LKSGIYSIVNILNNKIYIGSSINIKKRWASHKRKLRSNSHPNKKLQSAWNKYSEESFIFNIIEHSNIEILLIREQYYLDTLLYASSDDMKFKELGYNLVNRSGSTIGLNHTQETKDKMSKSKSIKSNKLKDIDFNSIIIEYSCRNNIILYNTSEIKDINNPFFNKKHTDYTKKIMSEKKKGKNNPHYGIGPMKDKKMSNETKRKIGISNSGYNNKNSKSVLQFSLDNVLIKEWSSSGEVGRVLNISQGNISNCCNKKQKTAYGFIWRYKEDLC